MNRRKKTKWQKAKNGVKLSILASIFVLIFTVILLINHLFSIQVPERLRYIKDYKDFTLSVVPVKDCEQKIYPLFQLNDTIYNGICIKEVFVNYGRVKAPLQMVLENKYITLKDIKKKLSHINLEEEKISYYEYRRSKQENENYRVTITPKEYQNLKMTEVTFEKYTEKKVVAKNEEKN